jgi:hypothetical protein
VKHKWPSVSDAPFLWLTFISWAAARRIGSIPWEHTYEAWEAEVLDVKALDDPDEADDLGRPTQPGLEPG